VQCHRNREYRPREGAGLAGKQSSMKGRIEHANGSSPEGKMIIPRSKDA